jgi:hypothetical protein
MSVGSDGGMISMGCNPLFVHQSYLAFPPAEAYEVPFSYPYGSLTCCEIFRRGNNIFTLPPKEVMLRIFIALKNLVFLSRV